MFAWPDSGTALLQALLTLGFVVKPQEGIELRQHLHVDDHGLVSFEGSPPKAVRRCARLTVSDASVLHGWLWASLLTSSCTRLVHRWRWTCLTCTLQQDTHSTHQHHSAGLIMGHPNSSFRPEDEAQTVLQIAKRCKVLDLFPFDPQ